MPDKINQADGSVIPIVAIAGSAAAGAAASSANATPTVNASMTPKGYQQITATGAAFGLGSIPSGARIALIQAEAQALRWRDDGTNPTTTVGMNLPVGVPVEYDGDLTAIKFIAAAAGAILNVTFMG